MCHLVNQHSGSKEIVVGIVECPHCQTKVVPTVDATCPACRKNMQADKALATRNQHKRKINEWESFQAALQPAGIDSAIIVIQQMETVRSDFRKTAISQFGQSPETDAEFSNRIRLEILPVFDAELNSQVTDGIGVDVVKSRDKTATREFLQDRRDCWRLLAEALEENDPIKLSMHAQAWDRLELVSVGIQGRTRKKKTKTPGVLTNEFTQALVAFTPRLIATPTIILLNVLVFVSMIASGINFLAPDNEAILNWGANFGPQTMNGEWWRLLTSMFLHFGVIHLAMNMWILWDFGKLVERLVGNTGFVVLYVISGLAGSLASLAWNPTVISAGASGAVFGVCGALLGLTAFRPDTIPTAVLNHIRNGLFFFLAFNLYYGLKTSGIDHAAHAGGIGAGFLCGLVQNQHLSSEMLRYRLRRNLLTAALGSVALITAIAMLPAAPLNTAIELERFYSVEDEALKSFERLVEDDAEGRISTAKFANSIVKKILPPWVEVKHRITKLAKMPYVDTGFFLRLSEYMAEREAAWLMYVDAMEENDDTLMDRANHKWKSANNLSENVLENVKAPAN